MAKVVLLPRRGRRRRSLTRLALINIVRSTGTSSATAHVAGRFGMIGTAAGTSSSFGDDAFLIGTSVGQAVVSGAMNVGQMVGTAPQNVSATQYPIVEGDPNVTLSIGFAPTQTLVSGVSGSAGSSIALSASLAVGTVYVEEIANQLDFEGRIKSLLPPSWFADSAQKVLDIPVAGMSYGLLWMYVFYLYVLKQSRIQTASDVWLDRISYDFFGPNLPRLLNEDDADFSARIRAEIVKQRQTRAAIVKSLQFLTGNTPKIAELWNPGDTGTYGTSASSGIGTQGYGAAGMYGSLLYRNQFLVTAFRPDGEGIPNIAGYSNVPWGYGISGGGEYCDLDQIVARVLDSDIYANIAAMLGAGNTAWTAILTPPDLIDAPMAYFGNVNNASVAAIAISFF